MEGQDSKRVGVMKVLCPHCNVTYRIISTKIPQGRRVVATCKKCGGKIVIEPSATKKEDQGKTD
jgi:predicted Zn finger-like uncharacterized protein